MRATVTLLIICFSLAACAQLDITRNETTSSGPRHEIQLHSFLWAFIPGRRVPALSTVCPGGQMDSARFYMANSDVWISVVTLGIYVPHRVTLYCSK